MTETEFRANPSNQDITKKSPSGAKEEYKPLTDH